MPARTYTDEERKQARERMKRLRSEAAYAEQDRVASRERMSRIRANRGFGTNFATPEAYKKLRRDVVRIHVKRAANPHFDKKYKSLRQAPKIYTAEQWEAIVLHYCPDGRCLRCGRVLSLTVDHVIPLSKEGENAAHNLQPLCGQCNSAKNNRIKDYRPDGGEFARSL